MDKIRIGVIGLGIGRHHIRGYQTHSAAEVVAIADLDKVRLDEIGTQYNVPKRYTSGEQMIEEGGLDVVSVATPNKFHQSLTVAALEAGCHVLCEKPMAMNADEARAMLAAAEKAGKRLMIDFSSRRSRLRSTPACWARSISHARCGTGGAACPALAAGLAKRRSRAAGR